jgi:hypothetical protein
MKGSVRYESVSRATQGPSLLEPSSLAKRDSLQRSVRALLTRPITCSRGRQTRCQSIEQTERGGHGGIDSNSSSSCPNLKFQRVGSLFGNSLPPHGSPRLHRRTGASAGGRRRAKRRPFRPGPVRTRMATCTGQGCRMGAEIQALRSLRELARLAGAPPWPPGVASRSPSSASSGATITATSPRVTRQARALIIDVVGCRRASSAVGVGGMGNRAFSRIWADR